MKPTQTAWVRDQLVKHGRVSRNMALRRYISRLAARIADLKAAGYQIEGRSIKTKQGRDYEYVLIDIV